MPLVGPQEIEELVFEDGVALSQQLQRLHIYLPHQSTFIAHAVLLESPSELIGGLNADRSVRIGAFTYSWSHLPTSIASVGRYCSIASGVVFGEIEHPTDWLSTSSFVYEPGWIWKAFADRYGGLHAPAELDDAVKRPRIVIGNDVWIGAGAYIRGGVTLGDGCIVGARAVVTRDVPPYGIVVGNPGKVVRYRFDPETIATLLDIAWWRYAFPDLNGSRVNDVHQTLDHLRNAIDHEAVQPYCPVLYRVSPLHG